jgi:hypothetical protein
MKRLRKENINTPEYFDRQWGKQDKGYHDPVRQKALIRHVKDNDLVIDVGAGLYGSCQYISRYTKIKAQLMCIDFSMQAAKLVTAMCPEIHYITANIDPIPFGPDSFDCLLAEINTHQLCFYFGIPGNVLAGTIQPGSHINNHVIILDVPDQCLLPHRIMIPLILLPPLPVKVFRGINVFFP